MLDQSIIPAGRYCKDVNGTCPHWSLNESQLDRRNGYCAFLGQGDWEVGENSWDSLLWDKVKECEINR